MLIFYTNLVGSIYATSLRDSRGCSLYAISAFVSRVAEFPCPVFSWSWSLSSCEVKTRYHITLFILNITCLRNQKLTTKGRSLSTKDERDSVLFHKFDLRNWQDIELVRRADNFWHFPADLPTIWAGKTKYSYPKHFSLSLRFRAAVHWL